MFLFVFPIMSACLTYELGIRIFELIGRIQPLQINPNS